MDSDFQGGLIGERFDMLPVRAEALPPLAKRLNSLGLDCPLVGDLRLAANHRLLEADELLKAFQFHGAVYVAGYAAEIGLGYCWARLTKADPNTPSQNVLKHARSRAKALIENGSLSFNLDADFRQGHSPLFWWRLYSCERQLAGQSVAFPVEQRVNLLVDFLHNAWEVWLRYLPRKATLHDAAEVVYRSRLVLKETYHLER